MFADTRTYGSFAVDDVPKAEAFYRDTLGLRTSIEEDMGGLLILHLAGDRPTIVYPKPDFVPATYTILNFEVDDIEAAVDELVGRGISMERYDGFDQDDRGIARGMGPGIAWFTDPAGNILAVVQRR